MIKKKTLELLTGRGCQISYSDLSQQLGKSRRQMIRVVQSLIDEGSLIRTTTGTKRWGRNNYVTTTDVHRDTTEALSYNGNTVDKNIRSLKGAAKFAAEDIRRAIAMKQTKNRLRTAAEVMQSIATESRTHEEIVSDFKKLPEKVSNIGMMWRTLVRLHYPDTGMSVPLKMKEQGQLSQIMKLLGNQTIEVLSEAIKEWPRFVKYFQTDNGVTADPNRPQIKFVLLYPQSAVRLLQCNSTKEQDVIEVVSPSALPDEEIQVPQVKDKPMTLDELNDIDNGN